MSPCREVCFDGLSEHCVPRKSTIVATEYVKADNKVSRIFRVKLEETDHVHHTSDWNGSLQRLNTLASSAVTSILQNGCWTRALQDHELHASMSAFGEGVRNYAQSKGIYDVLSKEFPSESPRCNQQFLRAN